MRGGNMKARHLKRTLSSEEDPIILRSFSIPVSIDAALEEEAIRQGVTKSELVRKLLKYSLQICGRID
jgi:hypothetical protein